MELVTGLYQLYFLILNILKVVKNMKNVIIFQDFVEAKTYGHAWDTEELFNYFRAQIDNSIYWGWKPEDIIVCTNLNFEYRDATIVKLDNICQFNKYDSSKNTL